MILYIKHIPIEGPGYIGEFFKEKGYDSLTVDLSLGEKLPEKLDGIKAVIVLGGPMNVYEEEKYSFLGKEDIFIKKVLHEKIPYLGICLGGQLLAKALEGGIKKSPEKEIGFCQVRLNENGKKDPLFSGIDDIFEVFQWHEDMFEVPEGCTLLAGSRGCPYQAFSFGDFAYGLQFHLEIDGELIRLWTQEYIDGGQDPSGKYREMLDRYRVLKNVFKKNARAMCENFEKMIKKDTDRFL